MIQDARVHAASEPAGSSAFTRRFQWSLAFAWTHNALHFYDDIGGSAGIRVDGEVISCGYLNLDHTEIASDTSSLSRTWLLCEGIKLHPELSDILNLFLPPRSLSALKCKDCENSDPRCTCGTCGGRGWVA